MKRIITFMDESGLHKRIATLQLSRAEIERVQIEKLNAILADIVPRNSLYKTKLKGFPAKIDSLDELGKLPFTTKDELLPIGSGNNLPRNLTFPLEAYSRFHQTSGTHGKPLPVLDTLDDWKWWIECWQYVLDSAEVTSNDRVMLAFSFGPFIGFWSAHDAVVARGALAIPGGGMDSAARLELMRQTEATVLCCTPTYALRLVEVANQIQFPLKELSLRRIIVAGEPGGSEASLRVRIEMALGATVIDHAGASEVGAWGIANKERTGLHVLEHEFIAEFLSIETGEPASEGELAQLVLTTLGRVGMPVIRYKTGDLVRPRWKNSNSSKEANHFVLLDGGLLGRVDDMMVIRGVNVFPSAVEAILRGFPDVVEYRLTASRIGAMDQLSIEIEDNKDQPERIAAKLKLQLGLNVAVNPVPLGSLPRYESKGRRFVDAREA